MTSRAVITGAGPVSGLGMGFNEHSTALKAGESAIGEITLFDPEPYSSACGAEVTDFDVCDYVESQQAYLDRSAELSFAAMRLAITHAGLDMSSIDLQATGLVLGSGWGCEDTSALFFADVIAKGPRFAKPFLFPHTYANTVISLLAMEYGLTGFHMHLASGATASAQALVQAYDLIRTGRQTMVFAGGYDSLSEPRMASESMLGRLSGGSGLTEACAPFDKSRNGTILGEGCGMLVVEEYEQAKQRGARILGEISGASLSGDITEAMQLATATEAGQACALASADGSQALDSMEIAGLRSVPNIASGEVPITALKSLLGETEGASGALDTVAALSILQDGFIPATLNLTDPEDTSLDFVMGEGRQTDVERVIVNAMDHTGNAVCLTIDKCE